MGRIFTVTLEGNTFSCKHCNTHLALVEDIVSKNFQCRHGKAYLFKGVWNVFAGQKEERMMMTGCHVVADIYCVWCGENVGWRYETAYERDQQYKEGKSVLERYMISGPDDTSYMLGHGTQSEESDAESQ